MISLRVRSDQLIFYHLYFKLVFERSVDLTVQIKSAGA